MNFQSKAIQTQSKKREMLKNIRIIHVSKKNQATTPTEFNASDENKISEFYVINGRQFKNYTTKE